MKKFTVNLKKLSTNSLKANSFLKLYGTHEITQFELKQLGRFDIPPGQVIATEDGIVLANWEEVEQAKMRGYEEIEVCVIEGIKEDHIPQIVSFKNIHKKKNIRNTAEIITVLYNYLKNNPVGKVWKQEVPGKNIVDKIAFLLDFSYGTAATIFKIYKKNPGLLEQINMGQITLKTADKICSSTKTVCSNTDCEENAVDDTESLEGNEEDTQIEKPGGIAPQPVKAPAATSNLIAGEKRTIPCESISKLQIIYESGRIVDLLITDKILSGLMFDIPATDIEYSGGLFMKSDNSEFHCFTTNGNRAGLQISIWGVNDLAA